MRSLTMRLNKRGWLESMSPDIYIILCLVPRLEPGNEFWEAPPLVKKKDAEPLGIHSQSEDWERG